MFTRTIQKLLRVLNLALVGVVGGVLIAPQIANALPGSRPETQPDRSDDEKNNASATRARGVAATGDGTISAPTIQATLSAETHRPATSPVAITPSLLTDSVKLTHLLTTEFPGTPTATVTAPKPLVASPSPSATHTESPTPSPSATHTASSEPTHTSTPTSSPKPTATHSSTPTPTHSSTSSSSSSSRSIKVASVLAFARAQLGERYVFGGMGNGWDCSGLTKAAFAAVGINIGTHSATNQYVTAKNKGYLVPYSSRQAGDLIFYTDGGGDMYHVTIYSGNGKMIEAADYGIPVREVAVRSGQRYGYVARFIRG